MQVTVKLYATLGRNRQGEEALELEPGTTARHVLKALEIPEDRVTLVFINGRHAEADQELKEGDTVAFFPPVGGG
ncbi:MAG: MoaD/ThiS family protein [Syntrophorhabdales bacterium]|jgi:molybdopterin converting factor small subunit